MPILDEADQKVMDDVREYGWHCTHVFGEKNRPSFSFTIGLWESLNAPEIILFGLESKFMHRILWGVFRQIQAGKEVKEGERWSDLIEGFDCISRPVHASQIREYFGTAIWYRHYRTGTIDLNACQLFWPGKKQGLFPWESGCDETVREHQPLLYLPLEAGIA